MGKRGKQEKQRRQQRRQFEALCEERLFQQQFEERCEEQLEREAVAADQAAVVQEQQQRAEAAAAVRAEKEQKERVEQGGGRTDTVQRAVGVLAGKIEEMRAEAEQREQRSQMLYESMHEGVGELTDDVSAVGRTVGRLQLPGVEHGMCLRALERVGQQWEQQAAKMAGAVEQMREEMRAVQAGQRELALLVHGLGAGVGDVGSGLGGLGSSVRAIQRQLDARTAEQKRLADRVSCWEAETGGRKISPPATVRKEKGLLCSSLQSETGVCGVHKGTRV